MPFIGTQPEVGGYSVLDALTASATASYTLQLNSANFVPNSANQLLVSLNGVIQKPGSSFTVSGSTLTFSSALASSDSIDFILVMGEPLLVGTPSDGTVSTAKIATDAVSTAKIANDAITNAKIGAGAVDATEIASSLNLSSKTLTMPQKFNGLQHIITVNPVGTNAFIQDLSSYEQVMVFFNNVEASSSGANIRINFGTANDGTTNGTVMNYIYHDFFVNDTTNMVGYGSAGTDAILIDNHWGAANAGTNGYFLIGGIGTGNTTNKRISYSGLMMKQSPSNQEVEIIGGQMQNDNNKYTHCKIRTTGGNFAGSTRFTFFGVNHYNV